MIELSKAYEPNKVEQEIYKRWEASGFFNPDNLPGAKRHKPFTISMPPPNVTGELHWGHALGMTLQDILVRYHRMAGDRTLWLPGTDHAAISTQVLVERELRASGVDRQQLGREKFLKRVWAWKEKYGRRIVEQIKAIGASADWSRERFTMDSDLTKAVQTAFIRLYRDGYIYRGERIINWCSDCQTAVSDLEVDHQDVPGHLWHIRYPLTDGTGNITVATTRPETMLGDTAIAVNPSDSRYAAVVGRSVTVPIVGRTIPVIADRRVTADFGSGAVKVTPAHDPMDFDLGHDHSLERLQVIGFDGRMAAAAGTDFSGLPVSAAREKILALLQTNGALVKTEDYIHAVGFCQRSKTVIEPLVSRQWFMRMKELAQPAIQAVRQGRVKIVPARYEKTYFHWLENIRDWNISRQIWWGHRLPVWYERRDRERVAPKVSAERPGSSWIQDEDTLDTWFSSGLWTFSTLGWPNNTKDLRTFHPTNMLVTGWDILFFWVARMMMFSLYFRREVPFSTVYLHGLVLDADGKKMSKSKGTGLDPIPTARKYGMDAFRMSLIVGMSPGQDFQLYEKKIEGYRNFANKLWNVSRFVLASPRPTGRVRASSLADQWVLSRLQSVIRETTEAIDGYDLSRAGQRLYDFVWHDFADWYIELSKLNPNPSVQYSVLETVLRLLHPFMPFVTEEIWSKLQSDSLLMVADWPRPVPRLKNEAVERQFSKLQATVVALRNFRAHSELPAGTPGTFRDSGEPKIDPAAVQLLTKVHVALADRLVPTGGYKEVFLGPVQFQFQAHFVEKYESWVMKERENLARFIGQLEGKLSNEQFVRRAKPEIVAQEQAKLADAKQRLLEL